MYSQVFRPENGSLPQFIHPPPPMQSTQHACACACIALAPISSHRPPCSQPGRSPQPRTPCELRATRSILNNLNHPTQEKKRNPGRPYGHMALPTAKPVMMRRDDSVAVSRS